MKKIKLFLVAIALLIFGGFIYAETTTSDLSSTASSTLSTTTSTSSDTTTSSDTSTSDTSSTTDSTSSSGGGTSGIFLNSPVLIPLDDSGDTASTTSILLKWIDNSNNEDKFIIERKLRAETDFKPLVELMSPNLTSYADTTVTGGLSYDYRIQACLSTYGCSEFIYLFDVIAPKTEQNEVKVGDIFNNINNMINPVLPENNKQDQSSTDSNDDTSTNSPSKTSPLYLPKLSMDEVSDNIEDIGLLVEEMKNKVEFTKQQLIKMVDDVVFEIIKKIDLTGKNVDTKNIYTAHVTLVNKINASFFSLVGIKESDINNLRREVEKGIENIKKLGGEEGTVFQSEVTNRERAEEALDMLLEAVRGQSKGLLYQNANLLYKDSNGDGISDHDSIYVYNLDPNKKSPVSTYEGEEIGASEKILLGYDPTRKELVKVEKEEPTESEAEVLSTYKVNEAELTEEKGILFKGQALPNSFITIYIYSTPIMVTVKTDSKGEWQYTLDKELENGEHTVYTATVNNSGNIVAKSSGFTFTKTAEAVTLGEIPIAEASLDEGEPTLLDKNNLYVGMILFSIVSIVILISIGVTTRKENQG